MTERPRHTRRLLGLALCIAVGLAWACGAPEGLLAVVGPLLVTALMTQ